METSDHNKNGAILKSQTSKTKNKNMKKINKFNLNTCILAVILIFTISNAFGQNKTCSDLKGIWYYWNEGASEPVIINFNACEWKESGNPMGDRKGSANYSAEKKKYEIIGLADADSGPVYLTKATDYYYIKWISSWTNKPAYIVLSKTKHNGRHVADIYQKLNAGGK